MPTAMIGLIGDRSDAVVAHRAIPTALAMAARELGVEVNHEWVPSEDIASTERVAGFDGLWCVPGSPYRSMEGVLLAIRYAREHQRPFAPAAAFNTPCSSTRGTFSAGATPITPSRRRARSAP